MHWHSKPEDVEGHIIFKIPVSRKWYFGLVFSPDWQQWFLGTFTLEK